ncbi:hypothetical protein [Sorangium sp. So ce385]|uniref:hypothetical protein n=1 Tax=Sorangium sp. So ce385 TaxID=3133308 RepID=UPI003F5C71F9
MPICKMARVTILSISVGKSEQYGGFWGIGGEPGNSAEWNLAFTVADQQKVKRFDGIVDDSIIAISIPFVVDLNSIGEDQLRVSVSGEEIDGSSANDVIPMAEYIITPKDNWVEGKTYTANAYSENFSYSFDFRVECADLRESEQPLADNKPMLLRYDGIWTPGNDGRPIVWGWTFEDLKKRNEHLFAKGYRLAHQESYKVNSGGRLYNAIWTPGNDGRPIVWGWALEDLKKKNGECFNSGFRMSHMHSYEIAPGERRYDAIWTPGNDGRPIVWGWTLEDLRKKNDQLYTQGMRMFLQQSYEVARGQRRYDAIWVPGNDGRPIVWGWTLEDLKKKNAELFGSGFRMSHMHSYDVAPGQRRYDAIWTPGNDERPIVWGDTFGDFQKKNGELYAAGMRLSFQHMYDIA